MEALSKLPATEQRDEDEKLSLRCIFTYDHARQCYFFGKVDVVFDTMPHLLEFYTKLRNSVRLANHIAVKNARL